LRSVSPLSNIRRGANNLKGSKAMGGLNVSKGRENQWVKGCRTKRMLSGERFKLKRRNTKYGGGDKRMVDQRLFRKFYKTKEVG